MVDTLALTYGRGWAFPPIFSLDKGVSMAEGEQDVMQSLRILFMTSPGERIMRPNYGCDMQSFMFRNICEEMISQITTAITDCILRYEERVDLESINIGKDKQNPNRLTIEVNYRLRGSDIVQEIVGNLNLGDGVPGSFT